jgi:hypothetical protein
MNLRRHFTRPVQVTGRHQELTFSPPRDLLL